MLFIRTTSSTYKDKKGRGPLGVVIFKDPKGHVRSLLQDVTKEEARKACPLLKIHDFKRDPHIVLDEIYEEYDNNKELLNNAN